MKNCFLKSYVAGLLASLLVYVSPWVSMFGWPLIGSYSMSLSLASMASPLVGFFGGTSLGFLVVMLQASRHLFFHGGSGVHMGWLVLMVPGFIAGMTLRSKNRVWYCMIPVVGMFAFIMHPVGSMVPLYTAYWLIPIVIAFLPVQHFFLDTLAVAYIAHVVGSVLWLYLVSTDAQLWTTLIPVVFFERLCIAVGITVLKGLIMYTTDLLISFLIPRLRSYAGFMKPVH